MPRRANNNTETQATIRIEYYRSFIAAPKTHKAIVRSLGLRKLRQVVERPDNDSMRGAVAKVPHLLRIVESGHKNAQKYSEKIFCVFCAFLWLIRS